MNRPPIQSCRRVSAAIATQTVEKNSFAASPGRVAQRLPLFVLCIAFFQSYAVAQTDNQPLKVVDQIWGFDGRVQPGQFNPLSILIDNQSDDPLDATMTLQRIQGILNPTGGQYTQQVFISPTGRRWIQFYPYVATSQQEEWRLTVGGKVLQTFTQPRPATKTGTDKEDPPPQVVIFDPANRIMTQPTALKHLPENVFPPYATVTFGLHTVFLDHVPDWETPRQQAFLSWLKQGGRLHLLKDSRDEYPRFTGELAAINEPFDRFTVGSGSVVRHAMQRGGVTRELVERVTTIDVLKGEDAEFAEEVEQAAANNAFQVSDEYEVEPQTTDESLFREMRELTLPDHAWWLIFLMALGYIALIFPGCFSLSKRKDLHFLTTYGAIVALSVTFSLLFLFIGRRGYGEATTLQTLAVARAEDPTHWNVLQWNTLFVTAGDDYSIQAPDQQVVLSTADSMERSNAIVVAGNMGKIDMRIPPFSSQTVMSRRRVKSADWKLQLTDFEGTTNNLVKLTIQTGEAFPANEDAKYFVLLGRNIYTLRYDSTVKQLQLFGARQSLGSFCRARFENGFQNPWAQPTQKGDRTNQQRFFDSSLPTLAQRSLLDDLVTKPSRFELPADRLRLLVYAPVPEDMEIEVSAPARRTGRILFTRDLLLSQ